MDCNHNSDDVFFQKIEKIFSRKKEVIFAGTSFIFTDETEHKAYYKYKNNSELIKNILKIKIFHLIPLILLKKIFRDN